MSIQTAFTLAKIGSSLIQGKSDRRMAKAEQALANEAAAGERKVTQARNFASAAAARLATAAKEVSNRRIANAAGRRAAAARAAIGAQRDAATSRTFEGRVGAAERAGALAAEAAVAGVTGGTADLIQGSLALTQARQRFAEARATEAAVAQLEVGGVAAAESGIQGLDNRTLFAEIDRSIAPMQGRRNAGHWTTDLLGAATGKEFVALGEDIQGKVSGMLNLFRPATSNFQFDPTVQPGFDRPKEGI